MLVTDKPEDVPTTDTLKSVPNPETHALQIPAIDATFVKFTGTSGDVLENPPDQDEERTYIVKGVCKGYDIRTRADGERRVVAVMDITSCYERGKVPIVDEKQASLFSVPDDDGGPGIARPDADADAEDESDGEGEYDAAEVDRPGFSDSGDN